jgi:hypothetical protein
MSHPRIYFFCREEENCLQNDIVALAEGLDQLGIPFYARANYWRTSPASADFLFKHTPEVRPDDCDVLVFPYAWFTWYLVGDREPRRRDFVEYITRRHRSYRTVYLDHNDGYQTVSWEPPFRQFDHIFRAKFNARAWQPANMLPWADGLTQRVVDLTADAPPFRERRRVVYVSYNASHPYAHSSRTAAVRRLHPALASLLPVYEPPFTDIGTPPGDPYDRLMWVQTNGRHSRTYYERLKSVAACSAFCGEIIPPMPFRPEIYLVGGNKAKLYRHFYDMLAWFDPRPARAVSCDSFRFWETLAAGTVAFNVDLEKYGARLPVMPVNWKHYIGVDFDRLDETVDRLRANPACLESIAAQGRAWALEHYSPKATARRFLETLGLPVS